MTITGFDHYTIRCADFQASLRFYAETLGLRVVDRPGLGIPAAIVYLDEMMLIHLFQSSPDLEAIFARLKPNPADAEAAQWATGRIHHIAFQARDLPAFRSRLNADGFAFTERTLERAGKHLVLLKDPDQVEIELAFALSELA